MAQHRGQCAQHKAEGRTATLAVFVLATSIVVAVGCFRAPDISKIQCNSDQTCPRDYTCLISGDAGLGKCQRKSPSNGSGSTAPDAVPTADAPAADISVSTDGSTGDGSVDGSTGGGGVDARTDGLTTGVGGMGGSIDAATAAVDASDVVIGGASTGTGGVIGGASTGTGGVIGSSGSTAKAMYSLSVTTTGDGSGRVESNPSGISCGNGGTSCVGQFVDGTLVRLTVTAASGSGFVGWGEACSGLGECQVSVDQARNVSASFSKTKTYLVSGMTSSAPAGTLVTATSTSPNATCSGGGCRVEAGGSVTLTAPAEAPGARFRDWSGGQGCASSSNSVTLAAVTTDITCTANYQAVFTVTVVVSGGPAGTAITPTPTTSGVTCSDGKCQVPSGGSISVTAPALIDWYFDGWTGGVVSSSSSVALSTITSSTTITAHYVNQRNVACIDSPPQNAVTTSNPAVSITYTTAGGWTTASVCPWACTAEYCPVGSGCAAQFVDVLASTASGGVSQLMGVDDRNATVYNQGIGQGITAATTVTMDRFGYYFSLFADMKVSLNTPRAAAITLERRDASGAVQASYNGNVTADFWGGWFYWSTPGVTLSAGVPYIFTAHLTSGSLQTVGGNAELDPSAGYAGGVTYVAQIPNSSSGDYTPWSVWHEIPGVDLNFRIQQKNPACP